MSESQAAGVWPGECVCEQGLRLERSGQVKMYTGWCVCTDRGRGEAG